LFQSDGRASFFETIETLFSPKLDPLYPQGGPISQAKRFDERGRDLFLIKEKYFYQNANTFYTSNFLYPPLVPAYYFPLAHTLLFFAHAFTQNFLVIICFGWIIIDIIILWKKKKRRVLFLEEK
jgi:hypothetical protein